MKLLVINNQYDEAKSIIRTFDRLSVSYDIVSFNCLGNFAEAHEFDGLILTGTDKPAHQNMDLYLDEIRIIQQWEKPLLAICGGLHVLAISFGGRVIELDEPVYGKVQANVIKPNDVFNISSNIFNIFSKHKYILENIPPGFEVNCCKYSENLIYGISHLSKPIFGVQFHPERRLDGDVVLKNFFHIVSRWQGVKKNRASSRLANIQANVFSELTKSKAKLKLDGGNIIDVSEGIPYEYPDPRLLEKLSIFCLKKNVHNYPTRFGIKLLRKAIKEYLQEEFQVCNNELEFLPASGSKELIAHITQSFVDPGDYVIAPDLYYPIYKVSCEYANGRLHTIPCTYSNGLKLDLDSVTEEIAEKAKLFWLNSPNNPTGAILGYQELLKLIRFCCKYDIVLVSDMAYSHIIYDESKPLSALSTELGTKNIIELHSLSKNLNVPGWRSAFLTGDPLVVSTVEQSKAVFDTGMFVAMQKSMFYALTKFKTYNKTIVDTYKNKFDIVCDELTKAGIKFTVPQGAIYFWCEVPFLQESIFFSKHLLDSKGVLVLPGESFGLKGKNHFRLSLTNSVENLISAVSRIKELVDSNDWAHEY